MTLPLKLEDNVTSQTFSIDKVIMLNIAHNLLGGFKVKFHWKDKAQ